MAQCRFRFTGPENGTAYPDILTIRNGQPPQNTAVNLLKTTDYVIHQQALPTLYLCVLYLTENKQRLVPLTA